MKGHVPLTRMNKSYIGSARKTLRTKERTLVTDSYSLGKQDKYFSSPKKEAMEKPQGAPRVSLLNLRLTF